MKYYSFLLCCFKSKKSRQTFNDDDVWNDDFYHELENYIQYKKQKNKQDTFYSSIHCVN